ADAPTADVADGTVGASCDGIHPCAPAFSCDALGWPGGYCWHAACSENSDCGTHGACVRLTEFNECYRRCAADGDCGRRGYVCASDSGVCLPSSAGRSFRSSPARAELLP